LHTVLPLPLATAIYREISKELCDRNFEKTDDQCKTRMHTLRKNFRLTNTSLRSSGRGRTVCKFYDKLNEVLGTKPATSPVKIVEPMNKKRKRSESDDQSLPLPLDLRLVFVRRKFLRNVCILVLH
jgi:hypothetical protein